MIFSLGTCPHCGSDLLVCRWVVRGHSKVLKALRSLVPYIPCILRTSSRRTAGLKAFLITHPAASACPTSDLLRAFSTDGSLPSAVGTDESPVLPSGHAVSSAIECLLSDPHLLDNFCHCRPVCRLTKIKRNPCFRKSLLHDPILLWSCLPNILTELTSGLEPFPGSSTH